MSSSASFRVTRVVRAVGAGRILNTKTTRSQIIGGRVCGIGMALHEETLVDHNFGRIMNANIAEYHVPVNADVHDIEVIFVDEPDDMVNPLGIKGLGEIGIVGVAASIANAIYHATGKRVRAKVGSRECHGPVGGIVSLACSVKLAACRCSPRTPSIPFAVTGASGMAGTGWAKHATAMLTEFLQSQRCQ